MGSTNSEALEHAKAGDVGQLWISATEQISGKGRRGREWVSKPGNLYASVLLIDPCDSQSLTSLPLVASLALHKALVTLKPELEPGLKIKWPNDILLHGKKLSGILLEATRDPQNRLAVVIGFGVNCQHFPENPLYPATSLARHGADISPSELFPHLARAMAAELRIWAGGNGFSILRGEWLERSIGRGDKITARFPDHEISGIFVDIDADGFLLLQDENQIVQQISAADIFFGNSDTSGA